MKLTSWLFVIACSLSLMGLHSSLAADDSASAPAETPQHYVIQFHPSKNLSVEDQAQLKFALEKGNFIGIQANPVTGIETITLVDKKNKPADQEPATYATLVEVIRQMVAANPQFPEFAGLGERVAKPILKAEHPDLALQPAAMELLKTSLSVETGIEPGWLAKHPDFMMWAMESGIARQALANGHKWTVGLQGVPILIMPEGRTNWMLLKKQGIVDEHGHMSKDVQYTPQGFVHASAPIGVEPGTKEDEDLFGDDTGFEDLFSGGDNAGSKEESQPTQVDPAVLAALKAHRVIHEDVLETLEAQYDGTFGTNKSCQTPFETDGSLGASCKLVSKDGEDVTIHDPDARIKLEAKSNVWKGTDDKTCEDQWSTDGILLKDCKLVTRTISGGTSGGLVHPGGNATSTFTAEQIEAQKKAQDALNATIGATKKVEEAAFKVTSALDIKDANAAFDDAKKNVEEARAATKLAEDKAKESGTPEAMKAAQDAVDSLKLAEEVVTQAEKAIKKKMDDEAKAAEAAAEQVINDNPLIKGLKFLATDGTISKQCRDDFLASTDHELNNGCRIKPIAVDYTIPNEWKTTIPHFSELYQIESDSAWPGYNDAACQKSLDTGVVPEWCVLGKKSEKDRDLGMADPKLAGLKLNGPDTCKVELLAINASGVREYKLSPGCDLRPTKDNVNIEFIPNYNTLYQVRKSTTNYQPTKQKCEDSFSVDHELIDGCLMELKAMSPSAGSGGGAP